MSRSQIRELRISRINAPRGCSPGRARGSFTTSLCEVIALACTFVGRHDQNVGVPAIGVMGTRSKRGVAALVLSCLSAAACTGSIGDGDSTVNPRGASGAESGVGTVATTATRTGAGTAGSVTVTGAG